MTRKPQTPNDDAGPAGTDQQPTDIAAGFRFTGNDEILDIERRLIDDGATLPNRAIPMDAHEINGYADADAIRERIEAETERENPNKQTIAYLNELLQDYE
jgi:hypothetical protein